MHNPLSDKTFIEAENKLNELMFPVTLGDVEVQISDEKVKAKGFKGVVRTDTNQVFSVVSDKYKLVTNLEALEIGRNIFKEMFDAVNIDEIRPYRVIYPKTRSYCHIQLVHEQTNFSVFDQDVWLPFIQVSNSYNKTFALSYELGFVKRLCKNGLIFNKNTVEIKAIHKRNDDIEWKLKLGLNELKKNEMEFIKSMQNIRRYHVDPKHIIPLICKVFDFRFMLDIDKEKGKISENEVKRIKKDRKEFMELQTVVYGLSDKYFNEIGHNAYAVFSIITDLISNHARSVKKFRKYTLLSPAYFYKPTEWVNVFIKEIEKPGFNMVDYLKDYTSCAA